MSLHSLLRKKCNLSLFTTPSHSQSFFVFNKLRNLYKYDISETNFHAPELALKLAEEKAAKIYGTKSTKFLTNGSTSGIITAVLASVKSGDNVLVAKNAHICHKNAVELAGANAIFYDVPQDKIFDVQESVNVELLSTYFKTNKIAAIIVTSPTYEGFVSDIKAIKNLCNKYSAKLIVDEAHGALYPFSDKLPESAVNIADFTVQSLHKTAGGLNPTAILHTMTECSLDKPFSMINTTSPSYPLLASIEANINFLNSKRGKKILNSIIERLDILRQKCAFCTFGGDDITKILVKVDGLSGNELSNILYKKYKIEDERTSNKASLLLCGIGTKMKNIDRLEKALLAISKTDITND